MGPRENQGKSIQQFDESDLQMNKSLHILAKKQFDVVRRKKLYYFGSASGAISPETAANISAERSLELAVQHHLECFQGIFRPASYPRIDWFCSNSLHGILDTAIF